MKNAKDLMISLAILAVLLPLIVVGVHEVMNTPDVAYSTATGACKYVEYPDGHRTNCDVLPERYSMHYEE